MRTGELEDVAAKLLREAGLTAEGPVCVVSLVRRLLGDRALRFAPEHALPGNGAIVRVGTEWRIYLRRGAPDHLKRFVTLHELAHWALGAEATEADCDRLAGALLLPRRAFLGALARRQRMSGVARVFGSDESCAWLRLGEVTDTPVALLTPRKVRVRGQFAWPSEPALREMAEGKRLPGLKKAVLRDDHQRAVLHAAIRESAAT